MKRKILLSLLVIAAVVAAVGLVTFAIFSDNIASDEQFFTAGTVDIEVDEYDEFFNTTLDMPNMEPGDCSEQEVVIHNKGTLPVDLWNWIYPSGEIFNCDPNPDCNMGVWKEFVTDDYDLVQEKLYPDPVVAGGEHETWRLHACLPLCAGNNCQGDSGSVRIYFHAVQQSNLEVGWNCVKLLHKEAPDWLPDPNWNPEGIGPGHGNKCYEDDVSTGPNVDFVVNGYNLHANQPLQIMLNGPGGCSVEDSIIAGDFNFDGQVDSGNYDQYYRGFWTGTAMSNQCSGTGEGVYAIAQGGNPAGPDYDAGAVTDAAGNFSGQWTAVLDACTSHPGETYTLQTKFLVKQDLYPAGGIYPEELDELDYQYITFTCP